MVGTRSSGSPQPLIFDVNAPASLLKINDSGAGGRRVVHPLAQKTSKVSSNVREELNVPLQNNSTTP